MVGHLGNRELSLTEVKGKIKTLGDFSVVVFSFVFLAILKNVKYFAEMQNRTVSFSHTQ